MTLDQAADRLHAVAVDAAERYVDSLLRQGIDPDDLADIAQPYLAELIAWYRDSWRDILAVARPTLH